MEKALSTIDKYTNKKPELNKGYYQVWEQNINKFQWKSVWGFTIQDYETLKYDSKKLIIKSNTKILKLDDKKNYYITKNPMITAKSRKGNNQLRGLTRLVIDIDRNNNSKPKESYYNSANRILWLIKRDLVETNEIPMFSKFVFSGRGLQLHYDLHQVAPFPYIIGLADMVLDSLINKIQSVLKRYEVPYTVDLGASHNHGGLIRLGGINQKSLETVIHKKYSYTYTLNELLVYFKVNLTPQKKTRRANVSIQSINLNAGRLKRLEYLQALRIASKSYIGYRNKLVFLYFNSLVGLNQENALNKVYQFNNKFPIPIPKSEIRAMQRYLSETGHLRFKSETFYNKWLEITPDEEKEIDKIINRIKNHSEAGKERTLKQNQKRKQKRINKKEYEKQKRINVLKDDTLTVKEQAELLGISVSRIYQLRKNIL